MDLRDSGGDVQATLWNAVGLLERGDWRTVLRPGGIGGVVTGSRDLVGSAVVLRLVARSMQLQAQGRLHDAWDRLGDAAALLPAALFRRDESTGAALAVLAPELLDGMPTDATLTLRVARLVWREQFELEDLRCRFAAGRVRPRDELVEACVQHLFWVEFDHFAFYRMDPGEPRWDDGTTVDRLRSVLCLRGSRLRQFADPTAGRLSQAVWQDVGGYRGLCALAFDGLADQSSPAPWRQVVGTSELPVRRGRLHAWGHARWRREDLAGLGGRVPTLATVPR